MFYKNIDVPVQSSVKYLAGLGLIILLVGMVYSVYLHKKTAAPASTKAEKIVQKGCPNYNSIEYKRCVVTEKPVLLETREITFSGESELCYIKPEGAKLLTRMVGVNSFEFKSADGVFEVWYKLIKRADLQDGKCPQTF